MIQIAVLFRRMLAPAIQPSVNGSKGPAQIEKDGHFAEKLTKEQAEIVAKELRNRIRAAEVGAGRQHSQCVKAALNAR
ncbi:hypothetical protein QA639_13690 [Bradyrhizobium pachyrhizi]|uniref:hypothetical protein n=1 Tax=Bradyrhizobium pachyrhizi TaxID=280333 RepID=UPI0024B1173C|nr:hypothetical protein [Bradyrhizobium pachyrhizi]WFU58472.1 hypothetical protein QA639_13690 [Bradyrhizobium pachyrhizi]